MKPYELYASTYESVAQREAHWFSDNALSINRFSSAFHTSAETPLDAARLFQESALFHDFSAQHIGKSVYIFCMNDSGDLTKI